MERRSEVFVKFQKKYISFFREGGGSGRGGGGGGRVGVCENAKKKSFLGGSGV